MNSLIVKAPGAPTTEPTIVSSPFWPEIDPVQIREDQRIDNTVTPGRLKAALIEAIATTNASLSTWRQAQITAGYTELAAVPADTIDNTSIMR